MVKTYILTCEHAGNEVPADYAYLFKGKEQVLFTHKAIDFGALRLAKHLASAAKLPLFYTTTCRLLVEANRSLENEDLFSDYTRHLPEKDKKAILDKYYFPYRHQVEQSIQREVAAGRQVLHLALHTFTPVLKGQVREADIGILFDPQRPLEQEYAHKFKEKLLAQNADRKVLYNSPYLGTADGLPTYLRKKYPHEQYAGFELEVNQKFFFHGDAEVWQQVVEEVTAAWKAVMGAD